MDKYYNLISKGLTAYREELNKLKWFEHSMISEQQFLDTAKNYDDVFACIALAEFNFDSEGFENVLDLEEII